jgi:hypothetical protein
VSGYHVPPTAGGPSDHRLHFHGGDDKILVPAFLLAETLQATQRVVHFLAMSKRGVSLRQRARVPQDIEQQFRIVCLVPE